jgi:hypothetical protein
VAVLIGLNVTQVLPGRLWAGAFLYIISPLVLAVLLYRTFQQDRLKGLLALLPVVMVLWYPVLEFVQPAVRAFVSVGAWLLMALMAATIIRWGNARQSLWMMLATNVLIGVCITYARTFLHDLPPEYAEAPTLERLVNRFSPPLLAVSALVIGLWLVWALWQIGKCSGQTGRWGHRLALAGLLLNLIGILGAAWWYTSPFDLLAYGDIHQIGSLMLKGATYIGFILYVLGRVCRCAMATVAAESCHSSVAHHSGRPAADDRIAHVVRFWDHSNRHADGPGTTRSRSARRGLRCRSGLVVAGRLAVGSPGQNRHPPQHDLTSGIVPDMPTLLKKQPLVWQSMALTLCALSAGLLLACSAAGYFLESPPRTYAMALADLDGWRPMPG